jgi:hypothetical protein
MQSALVGQTITQPFSFFNPQTDSKQFQNLSTAARCHLKNFDLAAQLAALDAVTTGTTAKHAHHWGYWQTYLKAIELNDDTFHSTISRGDQHLLVTGFAATI